MPTKKKTVKEKEIKEDSENSKELESEKIEETSKKDSESEEELKKRTSDRSVLMRELKKKAEEMKKKILGVESEDLKEEFEKKRELLVSLDDYVKTGIHLGTKVITPDLQKYVYRRRADSIGVLNTGLIDEQIKKAIDFMAKFKPEEIILVCKREAGWKAARLFEEVLGIKTYTKKYPAGMMTNIEIQDFNEPELVIVCDSWVDKNALKDAISTNKKVIMLADTNNYIKKCDVLVPANNKSSKSLGLVFYLLARGYVEKNKLDIQMPSMNSFVGDDGQEV
jgi:small subunit ribosomal protein S2